MGSLGCNMYSFPKLLNKVAWIIHRITQITHCANFQGFMETSLVTLSFYSYDTQEWSQTMYQPI